MVKEPGEFLSSATLLTEDSPQSSVAGIMNITTDYISLHVSSRITWAMKGL